MDDPDQTAPVPRDDGKTPPRRPTPREKRDMATGNQRAEPPRPQKPEDMPPRR
jgi:hypothetical protein